MLIDLPVPEIDKYMINFDLFISRIFQATEMLESHIEASLKTATSMPEAISENSEPSQSPKETQEG
jgi:hypothetical protein